MQVIVCNPDVYDCVWVFERRDISVMCLEGFTPNIVGVMAMALVEVCSNCYDSNCS